MAKTLTTVDLNDFRSKDAATRARFVTAFGEGLAELGFVSVYGHGLPEGLIADTYAQVKAFFDLETSAKEACALPGSQGNRGYVAFGQEHAKNRKVGDLKEFFHVGRDLPELGESGKNAFPASLPAFRETTTRLFTALDGVAASLLEALAIHFGEERTTFSRMADGGNSILRLIHYPKLGEVYVPGAVRAAEHEDINLLTLLPESTASGLEILTREGEWLAVETPPGHLVVDSGDMLERVTGGVVPSTTHRVVNPARPEDDVPRYSMPFFTHPRPDVVLELVPFAKGRSDAKQAPPMTADQFLRERLGQLGLVK
jgi:isopenicillin N synthase-like dioxygenase